MAVPSVRIRALKGGAPNPEGAFVLYWMTAFRRPDWNFSLDRALEWGRELGQPVVVLEALRQGYEYASDRLHQFVLEGMRDNALAFESSDLTYFPYLEGRAGEGSGLLESLAVRASVVVTDDAPFFFLPRMLERAKQVVSSRFEAVDSNGLLPLAVADRTFRRAVDFRRFLQRTLVEHLEMPEEAPRTDGVPPLDAEALDDVTARWPRFTSWSSIPTVVSSLAIDHSVASTGLEGGSRAARRILERFVVERLDRYKEGSRHPDEEAESGLSPYLHFGHISSHEVFSAVATAQRMTLADLPSSGRGEREGWWPVDSSAQAFFDQLVTWRELGFNYAARESHAVSLEALPEWAQRTLEDHRRDPRAVLADDVLERAETEDPIWNAAQRELVTKGRVQGYLRMLWGKKLLEWTPTPEHALQLMFRLNDRYALDGRDPNSASGIFWILGRYDRAWGPERPIFGKVRYMTSASTQRKLKLRRYLAELSLQTTLRFEGGA